MQRTMKPFRRLPDGFLQVMRLKEIIANSYKSFLRILSLSIFFLWKLESHKVAQNDVDVRDINNIYNTIINLIQYIYNINVT